MLYQSSTGLLYQSVFIHNEGRPNLSFRMCFLSHMNTIMYAVCIRICWYEMAFFNSKKREQVNANLQGILLCFLPNVGMKAKDKKFPFMLVTHCHLSLTSHHHIYINIHEVNSFWKVKVPFYWTEICTQAKQLAEQIQPFLDSSLGVEWVKYLNLQTLQVSKKLPSWPQKLTIFFIE